MTPTKSTRGRKRAVIKPPEHVTQEGVVARKAADDKRSLARPDRAVGSR